MTGRTGYGPSGAGMRPMPGGRQVFPPPGAGRRSDRLWSGRGERSRTDTGRLGTADRATSLVLAAQPLLQQASRIQETMEQPDLSVLQSWFADGVRAFRAVASSLLQNRQDVRTAGLLVCATIDDLIENSDWCGNNEWMGISMIATFDFDDIRGEVFYEVLNALLERLRHDEPDADALAFLALACLSAGFRGPLRSGPQGADQARAHMATLGRELRHLWRDADDRLSPHWRGEDVPRPPLWSSLSPLLPVLGAVLIAVIAYGCFSIGLTGRTDHVLDRYAALPQLPPPPRFPPPAPTPAPPPVPVSVAPVAGVRIVETVGAVSFDLGALNLFPSGSATVSDEARPALREVARRLDGLGLDGRIVIEGHTDSRQSRDPGFPNNELLSLMRAQAVAGVLRGELGGRAMDVRGKGASEPVDDNATALGRQRNRRVTVTVWREVTP